MIKDAEAGAEDTSTKEALYPEVETTTGAHGVVSEELEDGELEDGELEEVKIDDITQNGDMNGTANVCDGIHFLQSRLTTLTASFDFRAYSSTADARDEYNCRATGEARNAQRGHRWR